MKLYSFFAILIVLVLSQVTFGQIEKSPINIGESFTINSEILNQEREIFVWLPQGYDTSEYSYPIHFLLDGEITFLSYSGIVHIMSLAGQIPEAIVIGIPNINRDFDL
ncbi:MAG: alpha/beta hydrolase-fold protein, partial [Bacteroidota bacterium]